LFNKLNTVIVGVTISLHTVIVGGVNNVYINSQVYVCQKYLNDRIMKKKRNLSKMGLFGHITENEGKASETQSIDENMAFQSKLELQRKVIKNLEVILNNKTSEIPDH